MNYEFHEAANIFPLDEEHIGDLADDIKKNGQLVGIEILDGKILDGRRRWMACKKAKVEPWVVEVSNVDVPDPIAYVLSLNLHRRHLTVSQASMCAAKADGMLERLEAEAKERQGKRNDLKKDIPPKCAGSPKGETRDKLAEQFGVSHGSVDRARRVIASGNEELIKSVETGEIPVAKAASIASNPPELHEALIEAAKAKKSTQGKVSPQAKPQKDAGSKPEGVMQGVGVIRANEAINCLSRIPKNDGLRKRGFQIVSDWIKANK